MAATPKPTSPVLNTGDQFYPGLIMALPLAEGLGTVVSDISGNSHTANLISGATWVSDAELGTVVSLDGAASYIALDTALNSIVAGIPSVTIAMWLKLRNNVPSVATKTGFADLGGLSGANSGSRWPNTGGTADIAVFRSATLGRVNGIALGATNKALFHHVAITQQQGGAWKLYINGTLLSTQTAENPTPASILPKVGRSDDSAGPFFLDGYVGDVRIWSRELLISEVQSLFNAPWNLYTITAPIGQMKTEALSVDALTWHDPSMRNEILVADVCNNGSRFSGKTEVLVVDTCPFQSPGSSTPPNNPGTLPFNIPDAYDPRKKPDDSPAPTLNSDPINSGVIFAMPFTEGAGNPNDRSGNGFNGVLTGGAASWTTSLSSYLNRSLTAAPALRVNGGTGSYVRVTRNVTLEPASNITVAAWIRPQNFPGGTGTIIGKFDISNNNPYLLALNNSGVFRWSVIDVIDGQNTITGGSYANSLAATPYHVVGTYDGTLTKLYVNGIQVAVSGNSGNINYGGTPEDLFIGGDNHGLQNATSIIESACIWNRAISAAEVTQLYGSGSGVGQGPFGQYCTGTLAVADALIVDIAEPSDTAMKTEVLILDANPGLSATSAKTEILMVDAIAPVTNSAGLGFSTIDPLFGPTSGGTLVTIRGVNFQNITSVLVGGVALTSLSVGSSGVLTGVTGTHLAGSVPVQINSSSIGSLLTPFNVYTYAGGVGGNQLFVGKQFDPNIFKQLVFTGETATQGVDTQLSLTLPVLPVAPNLVELYIKHAADYGGALQRQGTTFNYTVDISTGKITWKATAPFGLVSSDEITVFYIGLN